MSERLAVVARVASLVLVVGAAIATSVARADDAPPLDTDAQAALEEALPDAYRTASPVLVTFFGAEPGLTLHVDATPDDPRDAQWIYVCLAPCGARLPSGPVRLALARGHEPVSVDAQITLEDGMHLVGHYESRQGWRDAGVGILLFSVVAALVGGALGAASVIGRDYDLAAAAFVGGGLVGLAGGATGVVLATGADVTSIDLR